MVGAGPSWAVPSHPNQVWVCLPEQMYYEVACRVKTMPRPVHPGPVPSQVGAGGGFGGPREMYATEKPRPALCHCSLQVPQTPEVTCHSRGQKGTAWDSSSSLTLGSSRSPSTGSSHRSVTRVSLFHCPEPTTVWTPSEPTANL